MPSDLRQRRVIPSGEIQILGRAMQDLMSPEGISPRQQQAVAFEDGQTIKQHSQVSGGSPSRLIGRPSPSASAPTPGGRADPGAAASGATC